MKKIRHYNTWWGLRLLILFLLFMSALLPISALTAESSKWPGVDEAVIEKFAKEHGRDTSVPIINMEQGDLPLFLFLVAGIVGGFTAGYYWQVVFFEGRSNKQEK